MQKFLSFIILCFLTTMSFAQTQSQDKIDSKEMNEAMEDAMKQLETIMDSVDFSQMFNSEMFQLDNLLDTSQMQMLMGGDLNDLFANLFPEGMDSKDLELMMQQGMMMFQNMDMKELDALLEGIDKDELNKMLEGLDFSELEKMMENQKPADKKDKKGTKRI